MMHLRLLPATHATHEKFAQTGLALPMPLLALIDADDPGFGEKKKGKKHNPLIGKLNS
jgi:hypothetical protein